MMFLSEKKVTYHLFINILFLIFLILEYFLFLLFNEFDLKLIEAQLLIIFVYSIFSTRIISNSWLSVYVIFLALTCLFLFSRPFLHLWGFTDSTVGYNEAQWYAENQNFSFKNSTLIKINFVFIFAILSLNLGYLLGFKKYGIRNISKKLSLSHAKIFNIQMAYFFYFVGLLGFLAKVYLYVQLLRNHGYFYLYSGNYTLPPLVRISDDFFYIGYLMIMMNFPSKKRGYFISAVTVILYATSLLTGMRGEFFTVLLSVIFLLSLIYKWRIGLFSIIFFGILLMLLGQSILMIKFSNVSYEINQLIDLIRIFIYSQGVSVLVLGYVIEFSDMFTGFYQGVRYFMSPFVSIFLVVTGQKQPRDVSNPTVEYNLSDQISYFIDIDRYRNGGGYGSGYIVELFAFGGDVIFVVLGCLFLGYLISFLSYQLIYKKYGLFIVMMIMPVLFWLPRSSIMTLGKRYLFSILIIICLTMVYNFIKTKKTAQ